MTEKFITCTVGLRAAHPRFKTRKLVCAEFYRIDSERVRIVMASGHNGAPMGTPSRIISNDTWLDSPEDPCNSIVRARWAFEMCDWEI